MILESKQEKDAFEFILNLASDTMGRAGCNDLEEKEKEKFKGLTVPTDDGGKIVQREITYDFDICSWLNEQKKEEY